MEKCTNVYCFECHKPFTLREDHEKNYNGSGLCPDCYNKVLAGSFEEPQHETYPAVPDLPEELIANAEKIAVTMEELSNQLKLMSELLATHFKYLGGLKNGSGEEGGEDH